LLLTFSTVTDQETRSFLQTKGVPTLAKPFEVADLISNVRTLIQREGKPATKPPTPTAVPTAQDASETKTSVAAAGS
jgi:hypothetical protein